MALFFHDIHGSNVQLTNNYTTATRKNPDTTNNGILFSSRPLVVGETVEVQLDKLASQIQDGGLEIGVTDNHPFLVRKALPEKATDLRQGQTIMVSGKIVAKNGQEDEEIDHNIHDIKPGENVAMHLCENVVKITCGYDCVVKYIEVDVTGWRQVYGVVDLVGKAEGVTITSISEKAFGELKKDATIMLQLLEKKDPKDVPNVAAKAICVYKAFNILSDLAQQQGVAFMSILKGGLIIPMYLKTLKEWGLEEVPLHGSLYIQLLNMGLYFVHIYPDLSKQFGESGLLKILTEELIARKNSQEETSMTIVNVSLGIVYYCGKLKDNAKLLSHYQFIQAAQPYTNVEIYPKDLGFHAAMAISHANEGSIQPMNEEIVSFMVRTVLKIAIDKKHHQFCSYHAYEICHGLANLAANEINREHAIELGAHGLFGRLLNNALDDEERLAALQALDAHICSTTCKTVSDHKDLISLLEKTQNTESSEVREKASDVVEKLTRLLKERQERIERKAAEADQSPVPAGAGKAQGSEGLKRANTVEDITGLLEQLYLSEACPYMEICEHFVHTLGLNGVFFNPKYDMCYCKLCLDLRKDEVYYERGNPPKLYGLPIGWYRFGLQLPPRALALDVFRKWHRAFHGTRHQSLPKILEVGGLVETGRTVLGGALIRELDGHYSDSRKPDGFDTKKVFLSPSIHYSGCDAYAAPERWNHKHKTYNTKVALQLCIAPNAYEVGPETIGAATCQIDPKFSNDELEWSTSQQGSTILYGLLVKLDEVA